jgi:hypothetical protein
MVDWKAHKKAHKSESCPVPGCGGVMRLDWDTYKCEKCGHFEQDPSLHDIIERDGGHLKFCDCPYCREQAKETA